MLGNGIKKNKSLNKNILKMNKINIIFMFDIHYSLDAPIICLATLK